MKLEQQILNIVPREESGSKTSKKYDFQKNLSLFLLIDQHEKRKDYVFLFDFHDDLAIANSPVTPTLLDFYQIKSKDRGNWTLSGLLKSHEDKFSILGKMYFNKLNFPNNTNSINFISNSTFQFTELKNGSKTTTMEHIFAKDMDDKDIQKCNDSIKNEHQLSTNPEFERLTQFHVTILSNKDSSTHCIGALNRLINSLYPQNQLNIELAYNQIFNEICRKTGATVSDKSLSNFNQLIELKGITKTQFLAFIEKAGLYKSVKQEWAEIKSSLENSGIQYMELLKFKNAWREVNARIVKEPNNIPLQNLKNNIGDSLKNKINTGEITDSMTLINIIEIIQKEIDHPVFENYFIKCLIIHCINNNEA